MLTFEYKVPLFALKFKEIICKFYELCVNSTVRVPKFAYKYIIASTSATIQITENTGKGIMNFAHLDLEVPDDVTVESIHLSENMMELSYRLGERR